MEDAIDKTRISTEEVRITAAELAKTRKSSTPHNARTGYFCPICRDPVRFIYSEKQIPHFRHLRHSPRAATCERYSSSKYACSSSKSPSSMFSGNSLFIRKEGESFSFLMGLEPLKKEEIEADGNIKVNVLNDAMHTIQTFTVKKVCTHANETGYLTLKSITGSFNLDYQEHPKYLENKWKDTTFGLQENGGLFAVGSEYCHYITPNSTINVDVEYYLVLSEDIDISEKSFIQVKETNKVKNVYLKDGVYDWLVYKIVFTEITQESWDFAQDLLVNLAVKEDTLTPLWPPAIADHNIRLYLENISEAFFLLQSTKDSTSCCMYDTKGKCSDIGISPCSAGFILTTPVEKKQLSLSVTGDKKPSDICLVTDKSPYLHSYTPPELELQYGKNVLDSRITDIYRVSSSNFIFKSSAKCTLYLKNKDNPLIVFWDTKSETIPHELIKLNSVLDIYHGNNLIKSLNFTQKSTSDNMEILSENFVLDMLDSTTGVKTIPTPAAYRYLLYRLRNKKELSKLLKRYIIDGNIPQKKAEIINKYFEIQNNLRK